MKGQDAGHEGYLQIGEAADSVGLTQRTLRYYEEKGLLDPPSRMDGGFRLYSPVDVERLNRITELKSLLGFSLAEIKEMIGAFYGRVRAYDSAFAEGPEALARAIRRNVYSAAPSDEEAPDLLSAYVRREIASLAAQPFEDIVAGKVHFGPPVSTKEA